MGRHILEGAWRAYAAPYYIEHQALHRASTSAPRPSIKHGLGGKSSTLSEKTSQNCRWLPCLIPIKGVYIVLAHRTMDVRERS